MTKPSYTYLAQAQWDEMIAALDAFCTPCTLCPRMCNVDRIAQAKGFCGAPAMPVISSIFPHHGEEPPISGSRGSGTVFFSHCTLKCAFCQNYQISHEHEGRLYSTDELAVEMLNLQARGCHNINLVTGTHFLPWIMRAIMIAARQGLAIPLVYNCGGYERIEVLRALSGSIDIYLPDMKYGSDEQATKFSCAPDYVEVNQRAVREMFRQVGPLKTDKNGIAYRGLCIRHLVLPNRLARTDAIFEFLKSHFDPSDIYVSLMAQYRPLYKACDYAELADGIDRACYEELKQEFIEAGFDGFYQEPEEMNNAFVIDFRKRKGRALDGTSVDWDDVE